ncbi:hypothetical protein [Thermus altitudinis]|nr:hypothetical protein [Thermus altitudinis]
MYPRLFGNRGIIAPHTPLFLKVNRAGDWLSPEEKDLEMARVA